VITMFNRELTSEQLIGFVEAHAKKDEITIPTEWVLEFVEAYKEKQERDATKQWLDDINNPLEPIKVESALKSEIMKLGYRKKHNPTSVSELDYTIIAVLAKELGCYEHKKPIGGVDGEL
jgi:hypothetical protein